MHRLQDELTQAIANGMATRTLTTCSRWAAYRRVMGEPFPGPYSWKYHPWVKELHDSWAPFNYVMKGAQLGVTEVAINRALYTLDKLKRDVLYVLPTTLNANRFSKSRFVPALNLSPYIRAMFTDINSINLKQTASNSLFINGSRGDSNLKNVPASELILDEVDEMEQKQIWLALERLSGQLHKHVWGISTPTVPDHGIHKLFKGSTQEHFVFRCPRCRRHTELVWPDCVEVVGEHATDVRCKQSFLKCKECKGRLEHEAKPEFLSSGHWKSMAANANPEVRGFFINQLYSFTVTPGELVVAYFRGFGDEWAAKEFNNSKLGMPFIGDGAKVTDEMIERALKSHSMDDLRPARGGDRLITLGADQGQAVCHAVVCEWLFTSVPDKDISAAAICKVLWAGKFPGEDWEFLDRLMCEWQVMYAVVDADPQINEARRFARRFPGFVGLCRYRRNQVAKEVSISEEDTGAPMLTVDRTSWLSSSLGRFKSNPPRIWLPRDIPTEFQEHCKNLVRTLQRDEHGNPVAVYVETGPEHFAHALTYAEIALPFAPQAIGQDIAKFM
jgi:hypothetical protein